MVKDVPDELCGPGRIVRRQTTYWELHAESGVSRRVHFSDKRETDFASKAYDQIDVVDQHPLLVAYGEPWTSFFTFNP